MCFIERRKIKTPTLILFYTAILFFFLLSSLYAGLTVYKSAEIRNKHNIWIKFDSPNGEILRIWLILKNRKSGVFYNKCIAYKVDSNSVRKIKNGENDRRVEIKEGRWIRWVISEVDTPSEELLEFMNGNKVVFQYYRADGKIMETGFNLEGAKEAIQEIMN